MGSCDLCGLPTPSPPIGRADGTETFCCHGCRRVATALDELDRADAASARGHLDDPTVGDVPEDAAVAFFVVDGMHCTTCEAFLRSRADAIPGVYRVDVNYSLESAKVYYDGKRHDETSLSSELSGYGYTFHRRQDDAEIDFWRRRRSQAEQRLIVGGFFTMLIMPWYFFYLYPLYVGFESGLLDLGRTTAVGIYFPLLVIGAMTTIVLAFTGFPLLRGAWISVRTREPNMDLLVSIAAVSAYLFSVLTLAQGGTHLYFDVTVMVVMVVSLGRYYEESLRSTATSALSAVTSARVNEAVRLTEVGRERIPLSQVMPGDELLVHPGERIPLDGNIVRGRADLDESLLTGESLPVTKAAGAAVIGGAKVLDSTITVEVGPAATSTIDRIAMAMWDIQSSRSSVQRFADALATIFVPAVLTLGVAVTLWRLLQGEPMNDAVLWGLTILLVSCPCAMGLATPLAISAGLRDALASGIVVANRSIFEVAPQADRLIFDKTGTLTTGEMHVAEVVGNRSSLRMAATVERLANHPVADAIVEAQRAELDAVADGGTAPTPGPERPKLAATERTAVDFEQHPGAGVSGRVDGERIVVGTPQFVASEVGRPTPELRAAIERIDAAGAMPVVVGWDGAARGVLRIEDRERPEWRSVIDRFGDRELTVLTGDDSGAIAMFRDHSQIDQVFSGVPPDAKAETVRRLGVEDTTVMIGDGTNDAPALAAADLGIAIGDGTADAYDAADVVVIDEDLRSVEAVFALAGGTRRRIRENICWALLYNAIALPLAVAGLINPFFAAAAMALSSVIVVSNSRRSIFTSPD